MLPVRLVLVMLNESSTCCKMSMNDIATWVLERLKKSMMP